MNILVVHDVFPRAEKSGSELRLLQILLGIRAQGHAVTYIARCADNGNDKEYHLTLQSLGIRVFAHDLQRLRYIGHDGPFEWTFDAVLNAGAFQIAILTTWFWFGISVPEHYMQSLRNISPDTKIVVLTDDVHGLRESQYARLTGDRSDTERAIDYSAREFLVYKNADMIVVISEVDRRRLHAHNPKLSIDLLPMIAHAEDNDPGLPRSERRGLLFLGDFANRSNAFAIDWLIKNVWPKVRARFGDIRMTVIGNNAPDSIGDTANGIQCLGFCPNLNEHFARARVFIAPMQFGTGIATRNLLALRHGLPVVTTSFGAEGLELTNDLHALVSDTPEEFAESIIRLYTDVFLWDRLSKRGREYVISKFSPDLFYSHLASILAKANDMARGRRTCDTFSCLTVERHYPDVLTYRPTEERVLRRCYAYSSYASALLQEGRYSEAQIQARHVFSFLRNKSTRHEPYQAAMELLMRCYSMQK